MAVDGEDGGRSPANPVCEACGQKCKDLNDFAVHQERHRPVDPPTVNPDTGKEVSYPCPEGCGRNFVALVRYRDHIPMCGGDPPLKPYLKNVASGYREGIIICPECGDAFKDFDKISLHLERHREVYPEVRHRRTGKLLSKACPKKCGRNFPHWREYEEHLALCDGQKPIPRNGWEHNGERKRLYPEKLKLIKGDPRMLRCDACVRDFKKAGPYAIHMRKVHGQDYRKAGEGSSNGSGNQTESASDEGAGAPGITASTLSSLRDKSHELRRKAARLDEIVNRIERLYQEAEDLL